MKEPRLLAFRQFRVNLTMRKNVNRDPKQSQPVWDALANLSGAVGQVTNVTSVLIPFLQDRELIGRIQDQARFNRLASTLDRDLRDMTQQLRSIQSQHDGRRGHTSDPNEVMRAIDIQEQYVEWAGRFDDVVIPTFTDMLEMIQVAGGNTAGVAVPSATGLAAAQDH
jgi:hypothetical protein